VILAAGLTPAWQQIARFNGLALGEVNRAAEVHWCASGKVLNVGVALAHLGAQCRVISPLGDDVAERAWREFARFGLSARLVVYQGPTRVCTTLIDSASARVTELVENAQPLGAECLADFRAAYEEEAARAEIVVLSGSLPSGTPATFYRDLLSLTPGRALLDARGPELLAALERRPFLIKPNREELSLTVGRPLDDDRKLWSAMRELIERGAEWIVVTEGTRAVWAGSADGLVRLQPLTIEQAVNPIGCGDCLAAGIAWGLSRGDDTLAAIRLGIAAAAQNAAQLLPGRLDGPKALRQADDVRTEHIAG
jgi:tagatose 6-phosphate kinase